MRIRAVGTLTEIALLGMIAIRMPGTQLEWDGEKMRFTNCDEANELVKPAFRGGLDFVAFSQRSTDAGSVVASGEVRWRVAFSQRSTDAGSVVASGEVRWRVAFSQRSTDAGSVVASGEVRWRVAFSQRSTDAGSVVASNAYLRGQ